MKKTILHIVTGLDQDVLDQCSSVERNEYTAIAVSFLIPMITGGLAATLVADYFTHNIFVKVLIVMVWVTIVWFVERIIANSLRPREKSLLSVSRFLLAICIGIIISNMVSLIIFRDRIETELAQRKELNIDFAKEKHRRNVDEIYKETNRRQMRYEQLQAQLYEETAGIKGKSSGHYGDGPAKRCLDTINFNALQQLNTEKLKADSLKARLDVELDRELQDIESKFNHAGFATSIETLNILSWPFGEGEWAILLTRILIATTLILLETIPLLSVCGKKKAEYHIICDALQDGNIALNAQCQEHRQQVLTIEQNLILDKKERECRYCDITDNVTNLQKTYILLAKAVKDITEEYLRLSSSTITEEESKKLKELYMSALESIECK